MVLATLAQRAGLAGGGFGLVLPGQGAHALRVGAAVGALQHRAEAPAPFAFAIGADHAFAWIPRATWRHRQFAGAGAALIAVLQPAFDLADDAAVEWLDPQVAAGAVFGEPAFADQLQLLARGLQAAEIPVGRGIERQREHAHAFAEQGVDPGGKVADAVRMHHRDGLRHRPA